MKLSYNSLRSRSRRVAGDSPSMKAAEGGGDGHDDETRQNCWADLPPEMLREIFVRVEENGRKWPMRKSVVACGGVCRSWREAVKEVVKIPEVSGSITFPISVKQPGHRDSLLQCFIRRNRSTQTYHLYLSLSQALADDGKFLLAARKCRRATCTDYIISLRASDMSKANSSYIGKVRSNFLGTKFFVYDSLPPHAGAKMVKSRSSRLVGSKQVSPFAHGNYPVAHISYELNRMGNRGPRRMHCVMDAIPASAIKPGGVAPTQMDFTINDIDSFPIVPSSSSKSNRSEKTLHGPLDSQRDGSLVLRNKAPRWHERLQCWCLNFHGRVTVASVKNFQLVAQPDNGETGPEHEKVILQFGKVGKDVFTMDYGFPLSAFQSFAICLSNFDTTIACE